MGRCRMHRHKARWGSGGATSDNGSPVGIVCRHPHHDHLHPHHHRRHHTCMSHWKKCWWLVSHLRIILPLLQLAIQKGLSIKAHYGTAYCSARRMGLLDFIVLAQSSWSMTTHLDQGNRDAHLSAASNNNWEDGLWSKWMVYDPNASSPNDQSFFKFAD